MWLPDVWRSMMSSSEVIPAPDRISAVHGAAVEEPELGRVPYLVAVASLCALFAWWTLRVSAAQPLWLDEIITASTAFGDDFWGAILYDGGNMLAFQALMRALDTGLTESALRLPALLWGVLSIFTFGLLARRLVGATTALLATLLLATHHTYLATQVWARGYSMTVFFALAAWWVLTDERPLGRWRGGAYVALATIALYCHLAAGFLLIAQLLWNWSVRSLASTLRLGIPIVGLALPLLWMTTQQAAAHPDQTLAKLLVALAGLAGVYVPRSSPILSVVIGAGYLVLFCAGLRDLYSRRKEVDVFGFRKAMAIWALVPVAVALVAIPVLPLTHTRSLLLVVPAVCLISALGATSLPRRRLALAIVLVISSASVTRIWLAHRMAGPAWGKLVEELSARSRPDDLVAFHPPSLRLPVELLLWQSGRQSPRPCGGGHWAFPAYPPPATTACQVPPGAILWVVGRPPGSPPEDLIRGLELTSWVEHPPRTSLASYRRVDFGLDGTASR